MPPFDHPHVLAGQGTPALELAEDAARRRPDAGCAAGRHRAAAAWSRGCALAHGGRLAGDPHLLRRAGREPTTPPARSRLGSGSRNAPGGSALCDALLAPTPGALTFAVNRTHAGRRRHGRRRVGAGGHALRLRSAQAGARSRAGRWPGGALLAKRFDARGKVVGAILCGGNIDPRGLRARTRGVEAGGLAAVKQPAAPFPGRARSAARGQGRMAKKDRKNERRSIVITQGGGRRGRPPRRRLEGRLRRFRDRDDGVLPADVAAQRHHRGAAPGPRRLFHPAQRVQPRLLRHGCSRSAAIRRSTRGTMVSDRGAQAVIEGKTSDAGGGGRRMPS